MKKGQCDSGSTIFVLYMPSKTIDYTELSLFAFFNYIIGELMRRVMVRRLTEREKCYDVEVYISLFLE